MAITSAVGDHWEVTVHGKQETAVTANVYNFRCVTPATNVQEQLCRWILQPWWEWLLPRMATNFSVTGLTYKLVAPSVSQSTFWEGLPNLQLGQGGAALPTFCAVCISKHTLLGGKSGRGRLYLPALAEQYTDGSSVISGSAYHTSLNAFVLQMLAYFVQGNSPPNATPFQWELYSRKLGGENEPLGAAGFHDIYNATFNLRIATMRSRKIPAPQI